MEVKLAEGDLEIEVDSKKCLSYGTCVSVAPDYLDLPSGAKNVEVLRRAISDDDLDDVEEAVRCCPVRALSLKRRS